MSNSTMLRFNNANRQFYSELKKRVDGYFKDNNISKSGNFNMYAKTVFMISLYFVPYFLIVFNVFDSKLVWWLLSFVMGTAMAGIGLCVMHDANHGSYSKNPKLNNFLGLTLNMLGGHALNWKIQHNVIHHTYTNVHEVDEDIAPPGFMRFEPHAELKKIHKFQFIYAWFFYGLMSLMWSTTKDFKQIIRYNKAGHLKASNTTFGAEIRKIVISKVVYFSYMLMPYFLIHDLTFLNWLAGFVTLHYVAAFILACIFQPAHVAAETEFPIAADGVNLENDWAVHQIKTTMNFGTRDRLFSWLVGGLNYQVEHHLFPTICHVHYRKISKIVKQTAEEFNLPYHNTKTFVGALYSHGKLLYSLGRA
jgi:linoleoyl-CoA desaturase